MCIYVGYVYIYIYIDSVINGVFSGFGSGEGVDVGGLGVSFGFDFVNVDEKVGFRNFRGFFGFDVLFVLFG